MKILIIGASGMVGHVLLSAFRNKNFDVIGVAQRKIDESIVQIDITHWDKLKSFLKVNKFDLVFNCSGILVQESNTHRLQAVYINSLFPHILVDFYDNTSTKVIHLSTGGVFSGNDEFFYEDSAPSPPTYYGITKAAGEFNDNGKDLIIRSDFWGPDSKKEGTGLFNWFLNQNNNEVKAFNKVYFNGISNVEFSRVALNLVQYSGVINIGGPEVISKGQLLEKIKNIFNMNVNLVPDDEVSKMVCLKNKSAIPPVNNYDIMVDDIYKYMTANREFYKDIYPLVLGQ